MANKEKEINKRRKVVNATQKRITKKSLSAMTTKGNAVATTSVRSTRNKSKKYEEYET